MSNKILAIISYFSILGWLISFFASNTKRDKLVSYHLEQALGLAIISIILSVAFLFLANIVAVLSYVGLAINIVLFILFIIGVLNAAKEEEKPLPLIGNLFVGKFPFLYK